jgi:hypothetical protein
MEKITRRIRDDYKLKATIIENVALSNPICTYTDKGELYTSYENCEIRMAVITPNFCKQLSMLTRVCTKDNYSSMIDDAKSFCTDVYNATRAYGYEDEKRHRILCLSIPNEKGIWIKTYYCLEDGCPQKINPCGIEARYIRKLSFDKSDKMSHKIWATTDWLKRI